MEVLIRDAVPDDLDALEELEKECFSLPWTREQLRNELPDGMHEFLAAEVDGKVAGYVGMMCVLDEGYISNVAVRPDVRRQGLGDGLIEAMLQTAAALSLAFVTLEVRESNAPAIALYQKHGFEAVGLRKNYYDLPKENALLMTKYLK